MKTWQLLSVLGLGASMVSGANAATVFADDFSSPDGTLLSATTPDVGGNYNIVAGGGDLDIQGGILDTQGAAREVYANLTQALGAGEIITLTWDSAESGGDMFGGGFGGISFYSGLTGTNGTAGTSELFYIGSPFGAQPWGVEESGVAGTINTTTNTDEDNTATFTYNFDTGAYTFSLSSGESVNGTAGAGKAFDSIRIINGAGADIAIDSLTVDISPIPEPGSLALLGLGGLMIARRRRA